jgi:hypothetical protein
MITAAASRTYRIIFKANLGARQPEQVPAESHLSSYATRIIPAESDVLHRNWLLTNYLRRHGGTKKSNLHGKFPSQRSSL